MNSPAPVKAAVTIAAALSLWGTIAYYGSPTGKQPYEIPAQAARLEALHAALTEDAVLGYVTDLQPGSVLASTAFNATQYILAPRLLWQDAARPRVLGNFNHPADFAAFGQARGLRIERDFGQGVILYRKERAP